MNNKPWQKIEYTDLPEVPEVGKMQIRNALWPMPMESHPEEVEFLLLQSGCKRIWVEDRCYEMLGGELLVVLPGERHGAEQDVQNRTSLSYFLMAVPTAGESFCMLEEGERRALWEQIQGLHGRKLKVSGAVCRAMDRLYDSANAGGPLERVRTRVCLLNVLFQVLKEAGDTGAALPDDIADSIRFIRESRGEMPDIARMAALKVGIPETASAYTVMRQCASAMTAVQNGAMSIMCGLNDVVIAGGTESMSNAVFYLRNARWGLGTGNTELVDALTEGQFRSQPQEVYGRYNMGATAENIAQELHISRQAQDEFSLTSQRRAVAAIDAGKFKDEIVPVEVPQGRKKPPIVFDTDEFPRRDTNEEKMAKLKPCFNIRKDEEGRLYGSAELTGTVTAASSSGRNDGASAVLLMSEEKARELGMKPLAKIRGMGTAGCDPRLMGLGPVYAVPKALENAGLTMDDIQLIELNEAFAAQSLGCIKLLGWEDKMDIINVNGGAIALGHPVGSSGCRIIVSLVHEMKRRGLKYGLATLCIAGGMGQATVLEMCD